MKKLYATISVILIWLFAFQAFATNTRVVNLDGNLEFLTVASDDDLDLMGNFTIEFWFDADNWAGGGSTAILANTPSGVVGYKIFCQINGAGCFFQEDGTTNYIGTFDAGTDTWYHMAWVFDGTNLKEFVASTSETTHGTYHSATYSPAHGASTENFQIGDMNNDYNGQIDEVRVWSVARTSGQLDSNFKNELCGTETGLIAYYRFENDASDSQINIGAKNLTENGTIDYPSSSPSPPFSTGASGCAGGASSAAFKLEEIIFIGQ